MDLAGGCGRSCGGKRRALLLQDGGNAGGGASGHHQHPVSLDEAGSVGGGRTQPGTLQRAIASEHTHTKMHARPTTRCETEAARFLEGALAP